MKKVAVLGGGAAGVSAAFELTRTPELRAMHDVTVYQIGWRLGGKGASGRNAQIGARIEEHGLHIWGGWYENAFRLVQACYDELGRQGDQPLATWQDAFKPFDVAFLYELYEGRWVQLEMPFCPNGDTPGDRSPIPAFWDIVGNAVGILELWWRQLFPTAGADAAVNHRDDAHPWWLCHVAQTMDADAERAGRLPVEAALAVAAKLARSHREADQAAHRMDGRHVLAWLLHHLREWLWERVDAALPDAEKWRRLYMQVDLFASLFCGMVTDGLIERGFDVVNDQDFRAWLASHGARPVTLGGPYVIAAYDGAFSYLSGDPTRPNLAAGVAVHGLLRQMCGYKGSPFWKMQAGMGDTVFAPLFEVLERRGVHFEFFHEVTRLHPSADGNRIDSIELRRQVDLVDGRFDPLVDVGGLPCWPSDPDWSQIRGGDQLRASGIDFECPTAPGPGPGTPVELRDGPDFDVIVLAIPAGVVKAIGADLVSGPGSKPALATMLSASVTVMTQSFQLWLQRPLDALGWRGPPVLSSTFVEPADTYCDMTHLLVREFWPEPRPASVGYFCGVLGDTDDDTQEAATARVRQSALDYLRDNVGVLWPDAIGPNGRFDFGLLVDPNNGTGESRLDGQYWRANFSPSERYTQAPSGAIEPRLRADQSGYANLFLAGDWVRNGLDAGCVEAAVMSGLQAARAVTGSNATVVGEDHGWIDPRRRTSSV